jgi:hypothetical protein
MRLGDVRARAAAALAPAEESDPPVFIDYPDAIDAPALIVIWDDPWLTPTTFCLYNAELAVLVVAGRVEAGPGVDTLERLAKYTIERLRGDPYPWAQSSSQAPRELAIGNIHYLGARITYRVPVIV